MSEDRRFAPATLRNRVPIAAVLRSWFPATGLILEIASGTGEHAVHFAREFPSLDWQPTDADENALTSIAAWRAETRLGNVREPLRLDAASRDWPIDRADAVVAINMVHISPWAATLGLLEGASRLLAHGSPLILYGPFIEAGVETAESNLAFDASLRATDPAWGLRQVDEVAREAAARGLVLSERSAMPANNLMLLLRRSE